MVFRKFSNSRPFSEARVGVTADIILGSPKKNCNGIGICRIERAMPNLVNKKTTKLCCRAKALMIEDKGELVFYFIRHTLTSCVLRKQFIKGFFKINEKAFIPDDIAVELGFSPNSYIDTGNYRVVDLGVHLCIAVKVRNEQQIQAVEN